MNKSTLDNNSQVSILVIGAGLAGSDASYYLAERGYQVVLAECKKFLPTPAQKTKHYAELVCTNSLKSKAANSAHGILKNEMHGLGSIVLKAAQKHQVGAGDALAVDRELFSKEVTEILSKHKNIKVIEKEIENPIDAMKELECEYVIVATGPLTSPKLEEWIQKEISGDDFYFYDAIAPVVDADSLDLSKMYLKDRHKEEPAIWADIEKLDDNFDSADYLNVPLNKEEYENFIGELRDSQKVPAQNFEDYKFFESCLPIDIMAERGIETARFSCMKPVGLELPSGEIPHACIQLRKENLLGSAYNLVGFQTRLTYGEQVRVFKTLPGFENASFNHLGSVHRNSFLNAKKLLNIDFSSKKFSNCYFAGQITGVEGYTESASMGLYVAYQLERRILGKQPYIWPRETGIGALVNYVMTVPKPTPSNINFGLIPAVELSKEQRRDRKKRKRIKKELAAKRAFEIFKQLKENPEFIN